MSPSNLCCATLCYARLFVALLRSCTLRFACTCPPDELGMPAAAPSKMAKHSPKRLKMAQESSKMVRIGRDGLQDGTI